MTRSLRVGRSARAVVVLAIAVALTFLAIEGATVLLGHELTWFGSLSPRTAAAVRYGVLLLAAVLIVAAGYKRRRHD